MKIPLPKNALVRQVLGALGGGLIALMLYEGYAFVVPFLPALPFHASAPAQTYTAEEREQRQERIVEMTKKKIEREMAAQR